MVFQPGITGNPKGRPKGSQSFVDRCKYICERYTHDDVLETIKDKKKLGKLPVFDSMIIKRLHEAITTDSYHSMNALLDRLIGKPKQTIEQEVTHNVVLERALKEVRELPAEDMLRIKAIIDGSTTEAEVLPPEG